MNGTPMSRTATVAVLLLAAAMFGWAARQIVLGARAETPYLLEQRTCESWNSSLQHGLEVCFEERRALVESEPACCYHGEDGMCLVRGWEVEKNKTTNLETTRD